MRREGKTFDVVGEVVGNHLVQQLGRALDNWCLEDAARVSPDTGLTRGHEDGGVYVRTEGNHLIIDELRRGVVFLQHRQELNDV